MFNDLEPHLNAETDDNALALRASMGDRQAFAALIERHYDLVFRVAYRFCGHREAAEDIAQDVCVSLPAKLKGYRGDAAFTTWLYRIVVNRAKDAKRKQITVDRKHAEFADVNSLSRGEAEAVARDLEWLDDAMARLPVDLQETAVLVVGEGLGHGEAAAILGVKEGTVSWRMSELKKALRAQAEEERIGA